MIEINDKKKILLEKLAKDYDLNLLILFGSQVTGKTHAESDFDIGYVSERNLDYGEEANIIAYLNGVLEAHDERLINLVNLKNVKPLLLYSAMSNPLVLYQVHSTFFNEMQAYAYKVYIEMKPVFNYKLSRMFQELEN